MANSSWTMANPIDHSLNSTWPDEVRNLKDLLKSRLILQDAEPSTRTDGAAFAAGDLGSIWIDSNSTIDNTMYILTATTPTWTKISVSLTAEIVAVAHTWAAAQKIEMADPTFTLTNTDSEDSEGGRQSRFIAKGLQSGDEETTLGYIEFGHSGAVDDQKGRCRIVLNDGDDDDAPSKIAIDFDSDGSIDVANSVCVLDEDAMGGDSAVKLATQQSIKAYITAVLISSASVAKAWATVGSDGTLAGNYNVSGSAKTETGKYTVTWDTDFADTNYAIIGTANADSMIVFVIAQATGTATIWIRSDSGTLTDATFYVAAFGTQ